MPEIYVDQPPKEIEKRLSEKRKSLVLEKKTSQNPLSALLVAPKDTSFEAQDKEEEILLLLRRHPILNLPWILLSIILIILPFFVLKPSFFQLFFGFTPPPKFFPASFLLWYLFTFAYALEHFLLWYFNVGIITDQRIVDVDFYGLVHKHLTDASLAKVQDVSSNQVGFFAALFNFGDVVVQTAAEITNIEFQKIPKPDWVADFIGDLVEAQEVK